VRRELKVGDKTFYKAPKVQRLITEKRIRRKTLNKKSRVDAWKANKESHVAYEKLLSKYLKEKKAAKKGDLAVAKAASATTPTKVPAAAAKTPAPVKAAKVAAKVEAPVKAAAKPEKAAKAGKGKK